ncbi:uncharacterized protein LOC132314063 [Cornus florida]|uniref:uncharacterized protein LOC132314063 n=1 Tax=Cornus florida TaxID=4283 RepID=UPI002899C2FB|nr:uncharacterized protein LOC132314063 [Cornus florida]
MTNIHDVEVMTWEEFRTLFFDRFFSRAIRQDMRIQFTGLYEGRMSVLEYETHFTSFPRYAPDILATDELRARKFQDGLHLDFRPRISVLDLRTYGEVVQKAMLVEAEDQDQLSIKGSYNQSRGEASSVSVGVQWKKAKAGDSSRVQGQSHRSQTGASTQGSRELVITVSSSNISRGSVHAYRIEHRVALVQRPHQHSLQLFSQVSGCLRHHSQSHHQLVLIRVGVLCLLLSDISWATRAVLSSQGLRDKLTHCHRPIPPQELLQFERDGFLCVDTLVGGPVFLDHICQGYAIQIAGRTLDFDFVIFDMMGFDIIPRMDWLSFFRATIDRFRGRLSVYTPKGDYFHFVGDQSNSHSMMIFSNGDWSRHMSYLASLLANEDSSLGRIYPTVVVEFLDVFPEELTELPLLREVVFAIDVILGTALISMAPYRMAPAKLDEHKAQLDDLKAKGYYQLRVKDDDIFKTAFRTRIGGRA